MAESLKIVEGTKDEKYKSLISQIKALIEDEEDLIANLSNTVAALKHAFDFFWVGVYFVQRRFLVRLKKVTFPVSFVLAKASSFI